MAENNVAAAAGARAEPAGTGHPAVIFRRNLGGIPGVVLGLRQPLVQVEISTVHRAGWDFRPFDAHLEGLTGEALPAALACRDDSASLLLRLHHHYSALQRAANIPVFDRCHLSPSRPNPATGMVDWRMTLPSGNPALASEVLHWLVLTANILLLDLKDRDGRLARSHQQLEQLRKKLSSHGLNNTNMIHFLRAAHEMGMAFEEIGSGVFAIGQGKHSRWLFSTITDRTPNIGCLIASNKQSTARLLRSHCLPAPDHQPVGDEAMAVRVAAQMGYPVVIKPLDQEQGRGVFAGLRDEKNLRMAYRAARKFSKNILVERHHDGEDFRLTVMEGRVIKVMHRKAAFVVGDGRSSVSQLVERLQQTPEHQRALRRTGTYRIEIDEEVVGLLAEQGLTPDDVPAKGRQLRLRRKSNISVGGTHSLYPIEAIHPDNCALAVRVAQIFGLDFAGIDLITPDIAVPWHENGAVICEVNAQPQLGYRDTPGLYHALLGQMVAGGGRIALHLLPVGPELPPLADLLALARQHGCNSLSTPDGVWRDGRQLVSAPASSFAAAKALLLDKETSAGLMVMRFADIARFGLPAADFMLLEPAEAGRAAPVDAAEQQVRALLRLHQERLARPDAA